MENNTKPDWLGSFPNIKAIGGRTMVDHIAIHPEDLPKIQRLPLDKNGNIVLKTIPVLL